jgi:cysteinyl-tRNA synthetase
LAGEWDEVLGIGLPVAAPGDARAEPARQEEVAPGEVGDLARLRDRYRRERRYAEADALREKIREAGYDVLDRKGKPATLKRI